MLATWAGVYEKSYTKGKQDAEKWLLANKATGQELFFDYCLDVSDFEYIFSNDIIDLLRRFRLFAEYQIQSFSNIYDELPAYWIDAIELISYNQKDAIKCRQNK